MYGSSGQKMDETSPTDPISLYGVTSLEREQICMERENTIAMRFATVFGASRKMRCDLLLNDFTYKAVTERPEVVERFMFLADGAHAECAKCDRSVRRVRFYGHGPRW